MDMGSPPLEIKILLESNPQKSRILVRRLAVVLCTGSAESLSAAMAGGGWLSRCRRASCRAADAAARTRPDGPLESLSPSKS